MYSPDGYARMGACVTINGSVQGPTIVARVGEVVEVVIVNALDQAGATVTHGNHYLGRRTSAGSDMVAQPVPPGGSMTLRFIAYPAGTHW